MDMAYDLPIPLARGQRDVVTFWISWPTRQTWSLTILQSTTVPAACAARNAGGQKPEVTTYSPPSRPT